LSRATQADTALPAVHHTVADITDHAALASATEGIDVVVHLAALLHDLRLPSDESEYRRTNVEGTRAVLAAARARGVKRFVFASTIAVYGSARSGALDEAAVTAPDTPYSRSKEEAERELGRFATGGYPPEVVVLRLAAVYGPGIKGNYDRLVRAIARRRFVTIGGGTNRRTLVYEDDAARAMVLAASHPASRGRTFNVVGGVHTVAEITSAIGTALERRPPRLGVPLNAARVAVSAIESVCAAVGYTTTVTRAALDKYTEDIAVQGDRIRQELGFTPQVGLLDGWRRTITGMRERGRLP
jgi:UDP-glucose 4-epimerase